MWMQMVWAVLGLVLLVAGGEGLVRGATAIALRLRVSPAVVGLTVVAAGTSMPELVVSVGAALSGAPDVAVANVVGSNIYNILLILGLSALVRPLTSSWASIRVEWPVMMVATVVVVAMAWDGSIARWEGGLLAVALVGFTGWLVRDARRAPPDQRDEAASAVAPMSPILAVLALLGGVALLGGGAQLLVDAASGLALAVGVSERVVGLTVVAVGTSFPELVTSVVASVRGNSGIALGNVLGSNIFNALGILGGTALVLPLPVQATTLALDVWVLLGSALVLFPLMWTGRTVSRLEGAVLLAGALVWTAVLV